MKVMCSVDFLDGNQDWIEFICYAYFKCVYGLSWITISSIFTEFKIGYEPVLVIAKPV